MADLLKKESVISGEVISGENSEEKNEKNGESGENGMTYLKTHDKNGMTDLNTNDKVQNFQWSEMGYLNKEVERIKINQEKSNLFSEDKSNKHMFSEIDKTISLEQQEGNTNGNKRYAAKTAKTLKRKKKKELESNEKSLSVMIRMNYLLQASFYLSRLDNDISQRYVKTMKRIGNKHLIKFSSHYKKLFCKKCSNVFIPGVTCNVSIHQMNLKKTKKIKNNSDNSGNYLFEAPVLSEINNKDTKKSRANCLVSYQCKSCKRFTKFTYQDPNVLHPDENKQDKQDKQDKEISKITEGNFFI